MSKLGESLLKGAKEALQYAQGKEVKAKLHKVSVPPQVDVKAIRKKIGLSRKEFADRYGFSVRTLEKWEQGVRQPESSARAYLLVIERNHSAVELALQGDSTNKSILIINQRKIDTTTWKLTNCNSPQYA